MAPSAALISNQYPKGVSGNAGRPRLGVLRIARYLRKKTKDGKDVSDFLVGVMNDAAVSTRVRVQAAEVILAYAFGKPKETIELIEEGRPGVDRRALIAQLSSDERATLEKLVDLALARHSQGAIDTTATPVPSSTHDARDAEPT